MQTLESVSMSEGTIINDADELKKFGISLGIVTVMTALPLLAVYLLGRYVSGMVVLTTIKHPLKIVIAIVVISILFEIGIRLIPTPEVRDAFASFARMFNSGLWVAWGLVLILWIVTEMWDTYASELNYYSSEDIALLVTRKGREIVYLAKKNGSNFKKHLHRHVDKGPDGYMRFDIRPMTWLTHLATEDARKCWAPVLEVFFPYFHNFKVNALNSIPGPPAPE